MVLRAQWPLGTIVQFFHFVAEEKNKNKKNKKKKTTKKRKAFYDWATTGIPVIIVSTKSKDKFCHVKFLSPLLHPH